MLNRKKFLTQCENIEDICEAITQGILVTWTKRLALSNAPSPTLVLLPLIWTLTVAVNTMDTAKNAVHLNIILPSTSAAVSVGFSVCCFRQPRSLNPEQLSQYWPDDRGFTAGSLGFLFATASRPALGTTQTRIQWVSLSTLITDYNTFQRSFWDKGKGKVDPVL
jgi:hypothetical protein